MHGQDCPPVYDPYVRERDCRHGRLARSCEDCDLEDDIAEALDAIDSYAAKDLDHELHSIVEHYRRALLPPVPTAGADDEHTSRESDSGCDTGAQSVPDQTPSRGRA